MNNNFQTLEKYEDTYINQSTDSTESTYLACF